MREPKRPCFQRRHYEQIADAVYSVGAGGQYKEELLDSLVRLFQRDNPQFHSAKFRERAEHGNSKV